MKYLLTLIFFNLCFNAVFSQIPKPVEKGCVRIAFFNCENFFDSVEDPTNSGDDAYQPSGELHWTYSRYQAKYNAIAKAIIGVGTTSPPVLMGLCEIENAHVLKDLCTKSPLSAAGYHFIHRDSPDHRGIDVALLYLPQQFEPIEIRFLRGKEPWTTREMLAVKGIIEQRDTLHLVICHWPSKKGGTEGELLRNETAQVARNYADSVFRYQSNACILFAGDFNDEAYTPALSQLCTNQTQPLFDLAVKTDSTTIGSHKFDGHWSIIDHFISSKSLISNHPGLKITTLQMRIAALPFLLIPDESRLGVKPFRTYTGFRYQGGTSDHLPVYIDLRLSDRF
jgi:predicted extracellular nuclease